MKDPMVEAVEQIEQAKLDAINKVAQEKLNAAQDFLALVASKLFNVAGPKQVADWVNAVKATSAPTECYFTLNGVSVAVMEQRTRSSYRRGYKDAQHLVVEIAFGSGRDNSRRYPVKDGSYNWAKAERFMRERVREINDVNKMRNDTQMRRTAMQKAADAMNLKKGCAKRVPLGDTKDSYISNGNAYVVPSSISSGTFKISSPEMTMDQAERVLDLLVEMGFAKEE